MKTRYNIALALLGGVGMGAVAVQSLYAQAQPPVYLVTQIDVIDPGAYGTEYAPKVQASIKAAGGRIIALGGAGGAGAKFVTQVEGQPPKRVVIHSTDYQEARKIICEVPQLCSRMEYKLDLRSISRTRRDWLVRRASKYIDR